MRHASRMLHRSGPSRERRQSAPRRCRGLRGFRRHAIRVTHSRHIEASLPMSDQAATPPDAAAVLPTAEPSIRTIAMPADTNPHGDIFGGWLLCQMDLAGATVATRRAGGRVVTVAITAMAFHRPVCVGDEVSCYAAVETIGHTSMTVKIESWARRGTGTT